jgi:phosphoribosylformylglycinamidine synthase
VRAAQGCHDAAIAYGAPFISGKDSLNNEYVDPQGVKRAVPPTLLVSSLGIVPDARQAVTMDLKAAGNLLYVIGDTEAELGGSLYHRLHGGLGSSVPAPRPEAIGAMRALHRAMRAGWVLACHDCSEGGLAVAAAEMALAGRLGLELNLVSLPCPTGIGRDDLLLFSESSGRFLVEVAPGNSVSFEAELVGYPLACLGRILDSADPGGEGGSPERGAGPDASLAPSPDHGLEARFLVRGLRGDLVIDCSVGNLLRAWKPVEVQG